MRKLLKILSVILAVAFIFSLSSLAYAEPETDTPVTDPVIEEYTTIGNTSTSISIKGITARCAGKITAMYSTSLKIKLELQKKKSSGYETIKTWTGSKTSTTFAMEGDRAINVLSTYRLKATYTAGSESTTIYAYP